MHFVTCIHEYYIIIVHYIQKTMLIQNGNRHGEEDKVP